MKNASLKLAAFLCALLLWFYVMSEREYTYTADIPVITKNIPRNIALSAQLPKFIKTAIKGSGKDLLLNKSNPGAYIFDLSTINLGDNTFFANKAQYQRPKNTSIAIITVFDDEGFTVQAETRVSKKVPIRNKVITNVAANYVMTGTPTIAPNHVTISGARSVVTKIFEIATEDIQINNLKKDTIIPINLTSAHQLVEQGHDSASVSISIQPLRIKLYSDIAVRLLNIPKDSNRYYLEPNSASVTVTGAKTELEKLKNSDISLFIEYNRFSIENKKKLKPTVKIDGKVQSYDLDPQKFELNIDSTHQTDSIL